MTRQRASRAVACRFPGGGRVSVRTIVGHVYTWAKGKRAFYDTPCPRVLFLFAVGYQASPLAGPRMRTLRALRWSLFTTVCCPLPWLYSRACGKVPASPMTNTHLLDTCTRYNRALGACIQPRLLRYRAFMSRARYWLKTKSSILFVSYYSPVHLRVLRLGFAYDILYRGHEDTAKQEIHRIVIRHRFYERRIFYRRGREIRRMVCVVTMLRRLLNFRRKDKVESMKNRFPEYGTATILRSISNDVRTPTAWKCCSQFTSYNNPY